MLKKIFLLLIILINSNLLLMTKSVNLLEIEKLRHMESSKDRFLEYIKMSKDPSGNTWKYSGTSVEIGDEAIFKDALELSNLTITDEADVRGATFEQGFFCTNGHFGKRTLWTGCTFKGYLKFEGAIFEDEANFSKTKIMNKSNFVLTEFKTIVNFDNAFFSDKSYWHKSKFNNKSTFINVTFKEVADFMAASFLWDIDFSNSIFEQKVIFRFTNFSKTTTFQKVLFKQQADFFAAQFNLNLNFSNSTFEQEALFRWTNFNGRLNFNNVKFLNLANFKYSNLINQSASFNNATYSGSNAQYIPEKFRISMKQTDAISSTEQYSY